ncbi:hypothetical protein EBZ80_19240 [bacterium]|nr:hypothetical protein [bacterium]
MDTRSNQSNPFMGFTSRKGERPNTPGYDSPPQSAPLNMSAFQKPQGVQTPFGSMAFVQQFLQNQAQYNQGLMGGQRPQRVDLGTTWNQAAQNIKDGRYQGNPFATGNVDALMGMFGQYGFTPPQGFQDQLLAQLGQQSAPPMYATQPAFDVPKFVNPSTGLPYGQPAPTQSPAPSAPPPPERATWTPPPPPPGGWRSEQQRRDAEYQSRVQYMMNPGLNQDASPVRQPASPTAGQDYLPAGTPAMSDKPAPGLVPYVVNEGSRSQRTVYVTPEDKQQLTAKADKYRRDERLHYEWWLRNTPEGAAEKENLERLVAQQPGSGGEYWPGVPMLQQPTPPATVTPPAPQPNSFAPGYGGSINAPPGSGRTMDFRDRDGDMIDDRDQPGPGLPPPGAAQPIPPSQQLPPGRMPDWGFPGYTQPIPPSQQLPYPIDPGFGEITNDKPLSPARQADADRIRQAAQQSQYREQVKEMQSRYPGRMPVDSKGRPWNGQGKISGWQMTPEAARQKRSEDVQNGQRLDAISGRATPTPTRSSGTRYGSKR